MLNGAWEAGCLHHIQAVIRRQQVVDLFKQPLTIDLKWQREPQMDTDEHRLTVDFYLGQFVFICGCFCTFRYKAFVHTFV